MRQILIGALTASILCIGPAFGDGPDNDPASRKPSEALRKAGRSLVGLENYHLSYSLRVGLVPTGSTHISSPVVQKSYSGPVQRNILSIPTERLFLSAQGGAAPDPNSGAYRAIKMHRDARKIALILDMPPEHLALALRKGRNARWIPGTSTIEVTLPSSVSQKNLKTMQNAECTGAT